MADKQHVHHDSRHASYAPSDSEWQRVKEVHQVNAMSDGPIFCFLDTNTLIHKQTFDEVDWPSIVGATNVCLVVAPLVLTELERHKNEGKNEWLQNRARTLVSKLRPHLRDSRLAAGQPISIRPHVELLYITKQPAVDWKMLGLDAGWNDDRLIASIIEFIAAHSDATVVFASDDTLCLAKALAHGIQIVDTDRVESQARTSPETAEIARLRSEIQRLSNRIPSLQLRFLEGGQPREVAIRSRTTPALTDEQQENFIVETLAHEQERFDAAMARGRAFVGDNKLKASDLEQYEQAFMVFLHRLPAWLPIKWSRNCGPSVDLWFMLDNTGTLPANDVRLTLAFPYGSFVTPRDEDPDFWGEVLMPDRPEATWMKPITATSWASILSRTQPLSLNVPLRPPARSAEPPRARGPMLSDETPERNIAKYAHPKLIQGGTWQMEPVRVYLPPSTGQGFQIEYQLRADELPDVITKTLPVKLTLDEISQLEA